MTGRHFHIVALALLLSVPLRAERVTDYVDPRIGSLGEGNVYIGPCHPFGMVKPSPDVLERANSGWKAMPMPIEGFAQLHVSGTGGASKYGNVLLMPFTRGYDLECHRSERSGENISLGYYSTVLSGDGTTVEITSARRASRYRITYPYAAEKGLEVDAGFCILAPPKGQRNLDGALTVTDDHHIEGYTTSEGGWGGGGPYTVYFAIESDLPIMRDTALCRQRNVIFGGASDILNLKVGISFISSSRALSNLEEDIPDWDFDKVRDALTDSWETLLGRIRLDRRAPDKYKRMFYTALYHSMLMPSDRTGEWAKAESWEPYYDDYFTLWDIYRTSLPLITLVDPAREAGIVQSLINIYRYDGFMPDGRSGNSNGATQGSSNADIVIADAFVKGLGGIDYRTGLEAMIKDAEVESARAGKEGRAGVRWYNTLGYLPWGTTGREGSRTVDASLCDYAISVVSEGLGCEDTASLYRSRSHNWENLWRDYEEDGVRGFIMPRDSLGGWLDRGLLIRPGRKDTLVVFRPDNGNGRWINFFYEANTYETSLCMPHDMDRLIELNGGRDSFHRRLDKLFEKGCYDSGNEPSFLSTSLYHWVGRPDKTSDICNRRIIEEYDDTPCGIPGNDDSGAMSSWMAFHMMGLYPVAGTDIYLVHSPLLGRVSIQPPGGRRFTVIARRLSPRRKYIKSARLDGRRMDISTIRHKDIVSGGRLVLRMSSGPSGWGERMFDNN